MNILTKIAHVS